MSQDKYIGMDVHEASISAAVRNAQGELLMECVLETRPRCFCCRGQEWYTKSPNSDYHGVSLLH